MRRSAATSDIHRLVSLRNLILSPDGDVAVFSRNGPTESGAGRVSSLLVLNMLDGSVQPFQPRFKRASSPAFSPDGSSVAFLGEEEDGNIQLYLHHLQDNSTFALTNATETLDHFLWSPDSRYIAILSTKKQGRLAPPGVKIHTRADFDSSGLSNSTISILAPKSPPRPELKQLISHEFSTKLSFWSKDSSMIFYTTDETREAYYGGPRSSLRSINFANAQAELVRHLTVPITGEKMGSAPDFVPNPDATCLAFSVENPEAPDEFAQNEIFIMDLDKGVVDNVTHEYDRGVGFDRMIWTDNSTILTINSDSGNYNLVKINVKTRTVKPVWEGDRVVKDFAYSHKNKRLLMIATDFTTPPEIYDVGDNNEARVLTSVNAAISSELIITAPEKISYIGPSGDTICGYLYKPPDFNPPHTYPMITLAHGGPFACWDSSYQGDIQAIAAAGYLVFLPNPRGSESYGQKFAAKLAVGWPGPEYDDIMAGIDYLIKRRYIDETKLGISGASAGGVLTDWAIGHTNCFKAAVSVSDIADFNLYWFLGDQPFMEDKNQDKEPWLDTIDKQVSPLTYAKNIATPTLFLSGTNDERTPVTVGGRLLFMVLKFLRVPTALIEFEGADHALKWSTDMRHEGLGIQYLIKWMDLHLFGKPSPEFDTV